MLLDMGTKAACVGSVPVGTPPRLSVSIGSLLRFKATPAITGDAQSASTAQTVVHEGDADPDGRVRED